MEFKDRLKELRKERGLSQQDLADEIFVSRSAVAKWENGRGIPDKVNLESLSKLFGVSAEELLSEEDRALFRNRKQNQRISIFGLAFSLICLIVLFLPMTDHRTGFVDTMYHYPIPAFFMLDAWGYVIAFLMSATLVFFAISALPRKIQLGTKKSWWVFRILAIASFVCMTALLLFVWWRKMDYLWIVCSLFILLFFAAMPVFCVLSFFKDANNGLRIKITVLASIAVLFAVALTVIFLLAGPQGYDWFFIPQYK